MKTNEQLLQERIINLSKLESVRVGDFIRWGNDRYGNPKYKRVAYDWGDKVQPCDGGSFYMSKNGHCLMSGSLNDSIEKSLLVETKQTKQGGIWFFDLDVSGGGRGKHFNVEFKVFEYKGKIKSPFEQTYGFYTYEDRYTKQEKYSISEIGNSTFSTTFNCEIEMLNWMKGRNLTFTGKKLGVYKNVIDGLYEEICLMISRKEFDKKYGHLQKTFKYCNGKTRAYADTSGKIAKIYYLNPNVKDREEIY